MIKKQVWVSYDFSLKMLAKFDEILMKPKKGGIRCLKGSVKTAMVADVDEMNGVICKQIF